MPEHATSISSTNWVLQAQTHFSSTASTHSAQWTESSAWSLVPIRSGVSICRALGSAELSPWSCCALESALESGLGVLGVAWDVTAQRSQVQAATWQQKLISRPTTRSVPQEIFEEPKG